MNKQKQRILIITGTWPSQNHPYITRLFVGLKDRFTQLSLFAFDASKIEYAKPFASSESISALNASTKLRCNAILNPFHHVHLWLKILSNPFHSYSIVNECIQNGLSLKHTYSQLFYYKALLGNTYDLVHINALQLGVHFQSKAWFKDASLLVSSRGQDFDFTPQKYTQMLKWANHVHVLSNDTLNAIVKTNLKHQNQITKIAPAIEAQKAVPLKLPQAKTETIHVVTAARLVWLKGIRYALQAIALLHQKEINIHYHIYGAGMQESELKTLCLVLGIEKIVTFYGWVNEDELVQKLPAYHLYLMPSVSEAFNNSVILAQSVGLPCIVSDAGGLPENIADGITGKVVKTFDARAIAEALLFLCSDPEQYHVLSQNAIERASHFSLAQQLAAYEALYQKLINNVST